VPFEPQVVHPVSPAQVRGRGHLHEQTCGKAEQEVPHGHAAGKKRVTPIAGRRPLSRIDVSRWNMRKSFDVFPADTDTAGRIERSRQIQRPSWRVNGWRGTEIRSRPGVHCLLMAVRMSGLPEWRYAACNGMTPRTPPVLAPHARPGPP